MTVSAQTLAFEYTANGVTTTFPYQCRILFAEQLKVFVNGVIQVGGYTLTNVGNQMGGDVIFSVAPTNGATVLIRRISDRVRTTDFQQAPYFTQEELLDLDQDYQTMLLQEAGALADNAIKTPSTELPTLPLPEIADRAGKFLFFDGSGNPVVSAGSNTDSSATQTFIQAGTGAVVRTSQDKMREAISVKDFGAVGDGSNDDTAAIQLAFDSPGLGPIYFPPGNYKLTGSGSACLTLTKNRNLIGCHRATTLRADSVGADTSLLRISFSDNAGFLDVRRWKMSGITAFFNGGGKHGLHIEGGFQILNSQIDGCSFGKGSHADGKGIYVINNLAHSEISNSAFDCAYMQCYDANIIRKCLTFGAGAAITFNCELGVRNNTVRDCTIVNRDGQVVIENGDNIRIINNQLELAQGLSPSASQSPVSAMVWIRGLDRPVFNTVIEDNNFGGGTNLNHSIYIDNGQRTVIDKNNFVAVNVAEVYQTANAKYNIIGRKNRISSQLSNPRPNTLFKEKTVDLGVGNMGVLKLGSLIAESDWVAGDHWKDEGGIVRFIGNFQDGDTTVGTLMAQMPIGFWPYIQNDTVKRNLTTYTEQVNNAAWVKSNVTVTADADIAPDGLTTADLVAANATTANHFTGSAAFSCDALTAYAFSLYLKKADAGSANEVRYEINDNSTTKFIRGILNLTTGGITVTSSGTFWSAVSATAEDAGNGWWRIKVLGTTTATGNSTSYRINIAPNNVASIFTSFLGDPAIHRVLVWGSQAEQASAVSDYQRVDDAATFLTVFKSITLAAVTASGNGYVTLSRQGALRVGSLPSDVDVKVCEYQAADIQT